MIGYVARDKDGSLYLYEINPEWEKTTEQWIGNCNFMKINDKDFPEFEHLTYKDNPIKVEIKLIKV